MAKTATAKRSFGFDMSEVSTEVPILESGFYAGVITNCAITGKEDKQFIGIAEDKKWDKKAKESVGQGTFSVSGFMTYGVTLISAKAKDKLKQDEPKVFGGMIRLVFEEDGKLSLKNNPAFGQFMQVTGLSSINFHESVDFDYDENIEVPEELANVTNIVDKLNAVVYYRRYFSLVANAANGIKVKANVQRRQVPNNPSVSETVLNMGSFSQPSAGIIAYVEGCEDDLEG